MHRFKRVLIKTIYFLCLWCYVKNINIGINLKKYNIGCVTVHPPAIGLLYTTTEEHLYSFRSSL